jgi:FkbM family methyltransferase
MLPVIGEILHWMGKKLRDDYRFLRKVSGVIHVGANTGQERNIYDKYSLHVIWIEPIPEIFDRLKINIEFHTRQSALQYLVTDQDGVEYDFFVSNNDGASSSILELKLHKDIWPQVIYDKKITLRSITLATLLRKEKINTRHYDALIIDTQGSELLVLKGAVPFLHIFKFIRVEAADFESYAGCCQLHEIKEFVTKHGFQEISRHKFAEYSKGGSYFDVLYGRKT